MSHLDDLEKNAIKKLKIAVCTAAVAGFFGGMATDGWIHVWKHNHQEMTVKENLQKKFDSLKADIPIYK